MNFSAQQISEILHGTVEGESSTMVSSLSKIEEGEKGSLSFLANPKYEEYIYNTKASIVIVSRDFQAEHPLNKTLTLIRVDNVHAAFGKLLELYSQTKNDQLGISESAVVSDTAKLGDNIYIGDLAVVGDNVMLEDNVKIFSTTSIGDNTSIGANTVVQSGVKIYSDTKIGANCIIHSGVIIGADGFGFVPNSENYYKKIPQIGNVIIEDFVEVGANTCIDRATLGSTKIRKGVKLDNLIQIAHNVEIGENTVIAAQTGIAGSTKIGKNCMIGGQVGIREHIEIADEVKIAAQSGVGHSVKEKGTIVQGSPALAIKDFKNSYALFRKLPDIQTKIDELENQLTILKSSVS